jgi:hypothetical protein
MPQIPIYHMASMARSGETLVLRYLSRHPRLKIVHNLKVVDEAYETALFRYLKTSSETHLDLDHPLLEPYQLKTGQALVLKQGKWRHRYPFQGFILVRNPLSIYASLRTYDAVPGKPLDETYPLMAARLRKWLKAMNPNALERFDSLLPVEQFCFFYRKRMEHFQSLDLPCVKYVDLVSSPEDSFHKICNAVNVPFEGSILSSDKRASEDKVGHGKHQMSSQINTASLDKYKTVLTAAEQKIIRRRAGPIAEAFGIQL